MLDPAGPSCQKSYRMENRNSRAVAMAVQSITPEPRRVYAIGDIHGCRDLLDRMIEKIRDDLRAFPVEHALTVTLGDYVDRGPDFARRR